MILYNIKYVDKAHINSVDHQNERKKKMQKGTAEKFGPIILSHMVCCSVHSFILFSSNCFSLCIIITLRLNLLVLCSNKVLDCRSTGVHTLDWSEFKENRASNRISLFLQFRNQIELSKNLNRTIAELKLDFIKKLTNLSRQRSNLYMI